MRNPFSAVLAAWTIALPVLAQCDAPEYFGICDPYVPGIILGRDGRVLDTWPNGPAEKAGLCPGDQIAAVNEVAICKGCQKQLVRAVVQTAPTPLALLVQRGDRRFRVTIVPIRESSLAAVSGRKFLRKRAVSTVQEVQGLDRLDEFYRITGARLGLKKVDDTLWLPCDFPDVDLPKLLAAAHDFSSSGRVKGVVAAYDAGQDYSSGLSLALLGAPAEAVVVQVLPASPAHLAGIRPGDRILAINGTDPLAVGENAVRLFLLGKHRLELIIRRGANRLPVVIQPQEAVLFGAAEIDPISGAPQSLSVVPDYAESKVEDSQIFGLHLLYDEVRRAAIVLDIDFPSPAFDRGIQIGDLVLGIDHAPLERLDKKAIREKLLPASRLEILLTVNRGKATIDLRLTSERYGSALAGISRKVTPRGILNISCCDSQEGISR